MTDQIFESMLDACERFGGSDGTFNAAGFGVAFMRRAGLRNGLDGIVVFTMLSGRDDVESLGGGYYRMRLPKPDSGPVLTRFDLILGD